MRPLIAIVGVLAFAAMAAMATIAPRGPVAAARPPSPSPRVFDWPVAQPTERPARAHPRSLTGFVLPIAPGELPTDEAYLPNSPRDYRAGYHEGIDFPAASGTPVLAAKAGIIVRIDTIFQDWSASEEQGAFDAARAQGYTPEATLDRIRGRQIWIDHGDRVVTRYAHLGGVGPLRLGDGVTQGQVIGAVGSSGYPDGGPHLHFEIRDVDDFYGDGLALPALRYALRAAFR